MLNSEEYIASLFEAELVDLWNKNDHLKSGSPEYNYNLDKILAIRRFLIKQQITLSSNIESRF